MEYHVVILSSDEVFSRMLALEFSMLRLRVRVLDGADVPFSAHVVLLDLDSARAPQNGTYREMIGFTRSSAMTASEARRRCAMILHRPFEMRLLRREVLAQLGEGADSFVPVSLQRNASVRAPSLALRLDGQTLYCGDHSIPLTPKETLLVQTLIDHKGETVNKQALSNIIGESSANKTEVYVCYLRRKIEQATGLRLILTVRGKGYRITE